MKTLKFNEVDFKISEFGNLTLNLSDCKIEISGVEIMALNMAVCAKLLSVNKIPEDLLQKIQEEFKRKG